MWARQPHIGHCRAVGETLAALHVATADYEGARENALGISAWRELIAGWYGRLDEIESGIQSEITGDLDRPEARWPCDLESGIIHADLFPDNVFFMDEKLAGIIDFYFACLDSSVHDIAVCMNAWCFKCDDSFNKVKACALAQAYETSVHCLAKSVKPCPC